MLNELPRRALFQFELPLRQLARRPPLDGTLRGWPKDSRLPAFIELEDQAPFADVYAGWSDDGLFFAFDVPQRTQPLRCDLTNWWKADGLRLCVDTRDARDIRRATRFCHFFYVLPTGGGGDRKAPVVGLHRMSRSKEPPPPVDPSLVKVAVRMAARRYAIEVAVPGACLFGWDPAEHPRIGIYYKIKDLQHGSQHLTVPDELGWNVDPSTWATAVLT
jgi:hypothetical protein